MPAAIGPASRTSPRRHRTTRPRQPQLGRGIVIDDILNFVDQLARIVVDIEPGDRSDAGT